MKRPVVFLSALAAVPLISAQAAEWAQCGGIGWTGETTCAAGLVCTEQNAYYSQCLRASGSSSGSSSTSAPPRTCPIATSTTPTSAAATSTTTTTATSSPAPTGFVRTSGQRFVLNGQPFTVVGTNAYWLAQQSDADLEIAFTDIANAGLTAVRTWGFNERTEPQDWGAYYQYWSNGVATFNTGAYGISRFDAVVAAARAHGIRLIVALTNNWSDYGGMDVYVSQLNPGGTHDTFYTNPAIIEAFKTYISNFVGRYKDSSTILAWELANEPRCGGSSGSPSSACDKKGSTIKAWAEDISAYIKSIDSNHLVGLGDEGWFAWDNPPNYPYSGGEGINFESNLEISTLDFGTFHAYPEYWGQSDTKLDWGVEWIANHAAAQSTANKPVILEEFGVTSNKENVYTAWWDEVISSNLTGDLIWQAGSQLSTGPTHDDGYAVYPTGTIYPLLTAHAAALKARG